MKRIILCVASGTLAVGALTLVGCGSNQSDLPPNERGTTAGGNGAFGESPAQPGEYSSSDKPANHNQTTTGQR